uniref:Uncharacterized protein n=1 Tax=Strigamia maritima TaxID=126957 RepID=T1IXQ9_STRMM
MRGFIYILLYVSVAFAFENNECNKMFDNHCYSVLTKFGKSNFKEARSRCQKNKGILAEIANQRTLDFISTILSETSNNISDALWIEFNTQRADGSWTPAKSRANRYHYSQRGSCTRLVVKTLKAAPGACSHLHYPLCQYPTSNCSIGDLAVPFTNFDDCNSNATIQFNTTIRVSCLDGYLLQGPEKVTCQPNGSWNHIPNCIAKCLPPLVNDAILIHNFKSEYNIGEQVLLLCDNGYFAGGKYLKSHRTITCHPGGHWKNPQNDSPLICIHEEHLNCPADICQSIQLHLRIDDRIDLNCTGNEDYGGDIWPHFHWLKDHERLNENNRFKLQQDGHLQIVSFKPQDKGMYTCVRGLNENHVEKVVVYDIRLKYQCEIDPDHNLPTIIVPEDTSVYLKSKGEASAINVAWFKNGARVWGDKQRIILPSGDLLIHRTQPSDEGYFTFEIESETFSDMCIDRTVKLSVIPRSSSICGLSEPSYPHPWLTSLWWNHEMVPFCYGVLINEQWVLTSAFCLSPFHRLKHHNISVSFGTGKAVTVENVIPHSLYSKRLNVNDVGLLKLTKPVVFGQMVRPICIPEEDFGRIGQPCVSNRKFIGNVSGQGSLDAVNNGKRAIRGEVMATVEGKICEKGVAFHFSDSMFCAELGSKEGAVYAADVGSPFEVNRDGRTFVYGIYSWGQRLAQVGYFDYFTKVSHYYEWIRQQLG